MSLGRITYRSRQFIKMLLGSGAAVDRHRVREILGPTQVELFERMLPAEQEHSYRVYCILLDQGETNRDLLVAALLHDSGKSVRPLKIWERVVIVLVKKVAPVYIEQWGSAGESLIGLRGAFQTAVQHPRWGAELAAEAGASELTCEIIRRHQDELDKIMDPPVDDLIRKLQAVDDNQ